MKNPAALISVVLALVALIFVCLSVTTRFASQIITTPEPTAEITAAPTDEPTPTPTPTPSPSPTPTPTIEPTPTIDASITTK